MIVVSVPEPAISGKAIGTTLPLLGFFSSLKNSTPKIISRPMINITRLPATAKDCTSNPNKLRNCWPTNKNNIINAPEAMVAWVERICPPIFSFRAINTGMEPKISITANKVNEIVINSLFEIFPKLSIDFFSNVGKLNDPQKERFKKGRPLPQLKNIKVLLQLHLDPSGHIKSLRGVASCYKVFLICYVLEICKNAKVFIE